MFRRSVRRCFAEYLEMDEFLLETGKSDYGSTMLKPQRHLYASPLKIPEFIDKAIEVPFIRPPKLHHGLEKIVRTQGIYKVDQFMKDSKDNFLKDIIRPTREAMNKFPRYTPPSQDTSLHSRAVKEGVRYITGSSSIGEAMMIIYHAITNFKSPDVTGLGSSYDNKNMNYMAAYRKPSTFWLRKTEDNIYAIDGDGGPLPASNIELSEMGIILEHMLTTPKEMFKKLMDPKYTLTEQEQQELLGSSRSYRLRRFGDMFVRSQIDCESISENGEYFVFEIKTRALAPLRYDVKNISAYLDYKVDQRTGLHSSYEREYFDLIRSILIKYFFQLKIGRMDGAFIAYHNTREIFGYEYLKVDEIEKRLFSSPEFSDMILKICVYLLQDILDEVTSMFPDDPLIKVGLYANYKLDELMILVERFDEYFDWEDSPEKIEGIEDIFDYYDAYYPGKIAYSFGRRIFPYINGILQNEPVFLDPGDKFELKQLKYSKGIMNYSDLCYFLHGAYKIDAMTHYKEYMGGWKKFNDHHVYRKPLYRSS